MGTYVRVSRGPWRVRVVGPGQAILTASSAALARCGKMWPAGTFRCCVVRFGATELIRSDRSPKSASGRSDPNSRRDVRDVRRYDFDLPRLWAVFHLYQWRAGLLRRARLL